MAVFDYAVKYAVTATCVSPLRTGGTEGDVELVLLSSDGRPMVQGGSIAGVLRAWVRTHGEEGMEKHLFGSSRSRDGDQTSRLSVSDGIFREKTDTQLRPRLRMDRDTGAGTDSQKFAMRSVETGSVFDFELLLRTKGRDEMAEKHLEQALSALHSGQIGFGGQSASGFGLVSLEVKFRRFDLKNAADRIAWMEDAKPTETLELPKLSVDAITFTVTGHTSGVLIRSGGRDTVGKKSGVALAMRDAGRFVLPGSSLKGILRARAELIARQLGCLEAVPELFGSGGNEDAAAGTLRVRECRMEDTRTQAITRTRINRFTGGVMEKKLFSEQPVSGAVCVEVTVLPRDAEQAVSKQSLGVLFYAMRDLAMGLYGIGSESSIGRGFLTDGTLAVQAGAKTCTLRFAEDGQAICTGDSSAAEEWLRTLEGGGQA